MEEERWTEKEVDREGDMSSKLYVYKFGLWEGRIVMKEVLLIQSAPRAQKRLWCI